MPPSVQAAPPAPSTTQLNQCCWLGKICKRTDFRDRAGVSRHLISCWDAKPALLLAIQVPVGCNITMHSLITRFSSIFVLAMRQGCKCTHDHVVKNWAPISAAAYQRHPSVAVPSCWTRSTERFLDAAACCSSSALRAATFAGNRLSTTSRNLTHTPAGQQEKHDIPTAALVPSAGPHLLGPVVTWQGRKTEHVVGVGLAVRG